MKIGYVLKRYPRLSETFIANEILGLEAHGIDVSIFALGFPAEPRFHPAVAQVNAPVDFLPDPDRTMSVRSAFSLLRYEGRIAAYADVMAFLDDLDERHQVQLLIQGLHLADAAERSGIDHLHAHFMTIAARTAYVAHLFTGIPFSVTAHAKDIFRDGVDREVFRTVARAAQPLITVSDFNVQAIHRVLAGAPADVVRIYNGLDTRAFNRPHAADAARVVLGVGRLVEKKGFDVLVDAMADVPDAEVVLIGEGEERERLERLIIDRGVHGRFRLIGAQRSDVVLDWMSRSRVLAAPFVVGSDGNHDALPTVLVEAAAAGLPVVASAIGGVPEIVDHMRTGIVVPTRDVASLAEALNRLLDDDRLHSSMARAAPVLAASRFDRSVVTPQWLDAIGHSMLGAVAS